MQNAEQESVHEELVPVALIAIETGEDVDLIADRFGEAVQLDDVGMRVVPISAARRFFTELAEHVARLVERPQPDSVPVGTGVPAAGEGLSAFETLAAQPGYTSVGDEFGRPKPNFLDEELARGQRQLAEERAEAEALKRAQRALDGRD